MLMFIDDMLLARQEMPKIKKKDGGYERKIICHLRNDRKCTV